MQPWFACIEKPAMHLMQSHWENTIFFQICMQRGQKSVENRPEDALGSLVETVETVETVEIGDCRDWRL